MGNCGESVRRIAVALLLGCAESTVSTPGGTAVVMREGEEMRGYECHYDEMYLRATGLAVELVYQALADCGYDYWALNMRSPTVCFTDQIGHPEPDAPGFLAGLSYSNGDTLITLFYPWGTQVAVENMSVPHEFIHLAAYTLPEHSDGDPIHADPVLWECAEPLAAENFVRILGPETM